MVNVDEAIIARLKSHGLHFEVLVDCDLALKLKGGATVDLSDVLASQKIFSDAKKGLVAAENQLKQVFSTTDISEIAKQIILKGEIQLTAEYKAKLHEEKRKRILTFIQKHGVDPKTHLPHPLKRVELAFEEAKIHIDEYKDEQQQISQIIAKLRPILPIKFERKELQITVPPLYAGKAYAVLQARVKVIEDHWGNDGSFTARVEIPAGLQSELVDTLNHLTHGDVTIDVVKVLEN